MCGVRPPPTVIYSDASFEPGKPIRVGWVVFRPGYLPVGQSLVLDEATTSAWQTRATDIFPAEAVCSVLVPWNQPDAFEGQDVLWFIDNEAAAAAVIRGASGSDDVDHIVQVAHALYQRLHSRVWFEWINSEANPSDGLSRDGFLDKWTRTQQWCLTVPSQPDWSLLDDLLP